MVLLARLCASFCALSVSLSHSCPDGVESTSFFPFSLLRYVGVIGSAWDDVMTHFTIGWDFSSRNCLDCLSLFPPLLSLFPRTSTSSLTSRCLCGLIFPPLCSCAKEKKYIEKFHFNLVLQREEPPEEGYK